MHNIKLYAVVLFALLATGCANTTVKKHVSFDNRIGEVTRVAVLPVDVDYVEISVTGTEALPEKEKLVEQEVLEAARTLLLDKGYQFESFNMDILQEDEEARLAVQRIKDSYQAASEKIMNNGKSKKKKKKKKKKKSKKSKEQSNSKKSKKEQYVGHSESVGELVLPLLPYTEADMLMLVYYYGWEKTAGKIATEVVVAVLTGVAAPASGAGAEIGLIDSQTGDIMWTNVRGIPNTDPEDLVEVVFKEFPPTAARKLELENSKGKRSKKKKSKSKKEVDFDDDIYS